MLQVLARLVVGPHSLSWSK